MSARKIQTTKNYKLFTRSTENRPTDLKKHKKLIESMKKYGFLSCFPIVCWRDKVGNLIVKDGQHRLMIAESLGLPVHWVEETVDFDVAEINCTGKTWALQDFARKHATNGLKAYEEGMEFATAHSIPLGTAFALLAGNTSFGNIQPQFIDGTFKVKDRKWADAVASIYGPLTLMQAALKTNHFVAACMAVCRVAEFEAKRLLQNAERCREKLVHYGSRDAYLDMLEHVYNFGRVKLFALKIAALTAMRERIVTNKKKDQGKAA